MRDEIERMLEEMEEGWQEPGGLDWDGARPAWRRGSRADDGPEGAAADGDTPRSGPGARTVAPRMGPGPVAGVGAAHPPVTAATASLNGALWAEGRRMGPWMDGPMAHTPDRAATATLEGGHERAGYGLPSARTGTAEGWTLFLEARRTRTAADHALRRRETVMVPVPSTAASGRPGMGAEELDRAFQRDARRYDGGFPFY